MNTLRKIILQVLNSLYQKINSGRSLEYNSSNVGKTVIHCEKYKQIFDNSIVGKSITSLDGKLEANKSFCEMLGYSEYELSQLKWTDITHPEDIEASDKVAKSLLSGETDSARWEMRCIHKNKEIVWVDISTSLQRDKEGRPLYYLTSIIDISKRKKAEDKLIDSETRYRRLFESAKDGILILDALSGKIVDANPFIAEILEYNCQELIGKELWEIGAFRNIFASKEAFADLQIKEYIRFDDMPLETKGGKFINVEFISNVYLVDNIKVIQCNIRDITQRKIAERLLLIAKDKAEESDRLKTAFLHNISHEIRTPLNAIVGFSGFLRDPQLTFEKRNHFTDIIIKSSDQLLSIIADIISIASIEAGQEKIRENKININLISKLIYEQFFPKLLNKNVTLSLQTILPDEEATITTDATKLTQILTNLISNALKFTQQGYVNFGFTKKDNLLEFYVEDTGIGIPLDMQDAIFTRFRQVETLDARKFGGSGLGLSISKAYVEMLGGKIWVTSELSKGSTFYFTIPYKKINKELSVIPSINKLPFELKAPKTILIAEDEDSNFLLLEMLLSGIGINIIRAVNGLEAVELCKLNPQINLVLMDIKMPVMDGYEATLRIKEFNPSLYIIAQTAYSTEEDKNKAFASGCSDFMTKPLKKEWLLSKIKEQLLN